MSAPQLVKTGWASVTETMAGTCIPLEGTTPEDTEPLIFETKEEAEGERAQYIDQRLESYSMEVNSGEFPDLIEELRESLESEEYVLLVGVDAAGNVFELDEMTRAIVGPILRPDR